MEKSVVVLMPPTETANHDQNRRLIDRGVWRMEVAAARLTTVRRIFFFIFIFLFHFVLSLDTLTRGTYSAFATSSFQQHSLLATINVIQGAVSTAVQPSVAKLSDTFGRIEVFTVGILLYTVGTIIQTVSADVQSYAGGAVLLAIGYRIISMTTQVMISDLTSVRSRLFFSYTANWPFLLNTWISGDVASAVLGVTTWKWGRGMFAIMVPIFSIPLIAFMFMLEREARRDIATCQKQGTIGAPFSKLSIIRQLFWDIDVIGVVLLTAALSMTLIPLTLAGGVATKWQDAGILAPLILGIIFLPIFCYWESKVKTPLFPLYLLKNRSVWAGIGIGCLQPLAYGIHSNYLYTVLMVAYDFSIKEATRIASLYGFCLTLVGAIMGIVAFQRRRLKYLSIFGLALWFVGGGLIYHYRGGLSDRAGLIGGEIVAGVAAGLFSWPTFVLVQAATPHQYLSVAISLVFTANSLGTAVGNCVAGAIWTQELYGTLRDKLASIDESLAAVVYASPFETALQFPIGTPIRDAIVESYRGIQRSLTIAAICFIAPAFIMGWFLHDPQLSDEQTQPEARQEEEKQKSITKSGGVGA